MLIVRVNSKIGCCPSSRAGVRTLAGESLVGWRPTHQLSKVCFSTHAPDWVQADDNRFSTLMEKISTIYTIYTIYHLNYVESKIFAQYLDLGY